MSKKQIPKCIQEIDIDNYYDIIKRASRDFRAIAKALNWEDRTWWLEPGEIVKTLTGLIEHAIEELQQGNFHGSIATGGFCVRYQYAPENLGVDIDINVELDSIIINE